MNSVISKECKFCFEADTASHDISSPVYRTVLQTCAAIFVSFTIIPVVSPGESAPSKKPETFGNLLTEPNRNETNDTPLVRTDAKIARV